MSERITLVVPDGTREKLNNRAKVQGHTSSSLGRKILIDGLKSNEIENVAINSDGILTATVSGKDLQFILDRGKK